SSVRGRSTHAKFALPRLALLSEPQTPTNSGSTSTSLGPGSAIGTDSTARLRVSGPRGSNGSIVSEPLRRNAATRLIASILRQECSCLGHRRRARDVPVRVGRGDVVLGAALEPHHVLDRCDEL